MTNEERKEVEGILSKHGYDNFTGDRRVVRVKGVGRYGERIAVHPEGGSYYTLYVRRRGRHNLEDILANVTGGEIVGPVLVFRHKTLQELDTTLSRLKVALEKHPTRI